MANYDGDPNKVRAVQTAINIAGYQPALVVDGTYGQKTAAGVKWFQGIHGLTQDGIIGDQTMAAITQPPPAAAQAIVAPLGALQAQIAQLQAGVTPPAAPSTALLPPAVAALAVAPSSGPNLPLTGIRPAAALAPAPPGMALANSIPGLSAISKAGLPVVPVLGAGGGALIGLAVKGAIGALLGGGVGIVAGLALTKFAPQVAARFHGEEDDVDFCAGLEPDPVMAGEIGMPMPQHTLRG